MKEVLLIKYGEIALRGKNRNLFEARLINTIRKSVKDKGNFYVHKEQGRFVLEDLDGDLNFDDIIPVVSKILGIVALCPCMVIDDNSIENIEEMCLLHMKKFYDDKNVTFKVSTKRSDKKYPLESNEISAAVGEKLLDNMPNLVVDVKNPEVVLNVELRTKTYIFSKVIKTYGGLPVGSNGRATLLLSGGIDSPVAGFLMAKRGVDLDCVYFHSPPYTSERAKDKVIDLAKNLAGFTGSINLYVIPFTETQLFIYENTPPEKMTILLKRVMLRVSEKICINNKCKALIVGDSIGQVASQTLESINAINFAVDTPIIRPLSGMDKQDIINLAEKTGSYKISIRPYEDCCTIFVAKHPETKPKRSIIEAIERKLFEKGLEELMVESIKNAEVLKLEP